MNNIIETKNLNYHFGKFRAIENLNLKVQHNCIYGFLGPNGAGKTTTIKIILGLLESKNDDVFLFNKRLNGNRTEILSNVGSLVENPSIYEHLTANENLRITAKLLGINNSRIDDVLKITGLHYAKHKKAGKFSLGMKQRLGISKALMSDPQLLILDEPTNGLDPAGIIEIRNLIVKLKEEKGKTIFLSSHLLSEIEKMCTDVGIIDKGKLLFQGKISELEKIDTKTLNIRCSKPETVTKYLSNNNYDFEIIGENIFSFSDVNDTKTAELIRQLVEMHIDIFTVEQRKLTLEELFIKMTE